MISKVREAAKRAVRSEALFVTILACLLPASAVVYLMWRAFE